MLTRMLTRTMGYPSILFALSALSIQPFHARTITALALSTEKENVKVITHDARPHLSQFTRRYSRGRNKKQKKKREEKEQKREEKREKKKNGPTAQRPLRPTKKPPRAKPKPRPPAADPGKNGGKGKGPTPSAPTRKPKPKPTRKPKAKPTPTKAKPKPTRKPQKAPAPTPKPKKAPAPAVKLSRAVATVYGILDSKRSRIDDEIFLYQGRTPSTVYRYAGFVAGLKVMVEDGVAGGQYYLGDDRENGHLYGLVNIAAFLGQSMKETIQYDACDENNWDFFDVPVIYPLANACGQLEQSYQDYHCPEHERHMECEVDNDMSLQATTHAKWYGAPGPFFCGPRSQYPAVGIWDYRYECHNPWADPPVSCDTYEGQRAGRYDNSNPVSNRNGRTDVEGCCWWGRGVIQTTGICNFGKLNYYLGARAEKEGRSSRYPTVDFCKDPGVICSSEEHKELKWIAGMFYWIESLQSYDERGWNYIDELHKFVDGGMSDNSFIDGISGVVNRGCHDPPCGTGPVDGLHERASNFKKVLTLFTS